MVLDRIKSAPRNYYESEMDRWEETKSDPAGAFADNFRFGLTGPAPSLQPNDESPFSPKIDYGDGPVGWVNKKADDSVTKYTGFQPLGDELGDGGGFVKVVLGTVTLFGGIYVLGQLFDIQVGGS